MTATQQLWMASLGGAVVFFAAGVVLMSLRARGRSGPQPMQGGGASMELEQARERAERADAATVQLRAAEQQARETERKTRDELAAARKQLEDERARGRSAAPASNEGARAAEQARAELAAIQRKLAATEDARVAAEDARKLAEGALRRAEATAQASHDHAALDRQAAELQERLRDADRALTERSGQLREALTQVEYLKSRVSDAETLRADYTRLRTQISEMEFLNKEVERLREALQSAKSMALGGTERAPRPVRVAAAAAAGGSITDALSGALERFSDAQMRSIAIADNVGFPVSSFGDDGLELAAYAALLNDVASRANQFLPVATPASIEMVDEHGARVSVWPFEVGGDRLLLVNLSVGATEASKVEGMLSDVTSILAPSEFQSSGNSAS